MNRVFREEKKYLISLPEALQACHRLAQVMHEDPHNGISGYPVRSLYFDTLDDRDFHEKAAGVELRRNPHSHAAAVAQMKRFCIERGAWMDENIDILRQYSHESKNKKFNH